MNKFAEQFQNDVVVRYQEKMAELMEKIATPSLAKYLQAARKRNMAVNRARGALDSYTRNPDRKDSLFHLGQDLASNLGSVGNKAMDEATGGITRAIRSNILNNPEQLLRPAFLHPDTISAAAVSARPNPEYLSKLTGITDSNALKQILADPENFIKLK